MTAPFPIITDGGVGDVPINMYPAPDSERGSILEPSPGLLALCNFPNCSQIRGLYSWGDYIYAVVKRASQTAVFRVSADGTYSEIGFFTTSSTGPVSMVNNPSQLCIVDGVWGYVFTPTTGLFESITSENFPGAGGVAFQDGYGLFFQPDTTMWFFSDINDFLTFDATHRYYQRAHNDNISNIISYKQQVWIFGELAYEVWYDYGGDDSSPTNPTFARYKDGIVKAGLGATFTLTDTDGAAVSWLRDKNDFILAVGMQPATMTNQMFSRALSAMPTITDATSFCYTDRGHTFVQINFTSGDQTWVFDATAKLWHKKQSQKANKEYGRHIGDCYCYHQNKHFVGGFEDGTIYEMNENYYTDNGSVIRRELYTKETDSGINPVRHPPFQLILEPGVGLEDGTDPQVMLQYSNTSGKTYSSELWRSAGLVGEHYRKAVWWRLGSSSRRMEKIVMTDPVLWRVKGIDKGGKGAVS